MANRYWVGSTGTWTLTLTTNWSASSGGTGGASAPTAVDNVYFDLNSNPLFTCTVTVLTATCASLNIIGLARPLTLNLGTLYTNTLTVYGAISIATTTTNFNFSSTSPSWSTATYNVFTTRSFIVYAMTATSLTIAPQALSINKISGSANLAAVLGITTMTSSRLPLSSTNIAEVPVITTASSTSLAFTPNYFSILPTTPYRDVEKFGLNSSNTITPLPYQFWG